MEISIPWKTDDDGTPIPYVYTASKEEIELYVKPVADNFVRELKIGFEKVCHFTCFLFFFQQTSISQLIAYNNFFLGQFRT